MHLGPRIQRRRFGYTPMRLKEEQPDLRERLKLERTPGTEAKSGALVRLLLLALAAVALIHWLFPEVTSDLLRGQVLIDRGDLR